jgi:hypothetical protein
MTITKIVALLAIALITSAQSPYPVHAVWKWQDGILARRQAETLPPKEFDHPVRGDMEVTITRTDVPGIHKACNTVKFRQGFLAVGCAVITSTKCDVYIATDDILFTASQTYDAVWRHERGHCNGYYSSQAG